MITAILLLAGNSERLGLKDTFKQFIQINNKELYLFALEELIKNNNIDNVLLVYKSEHFDLIKNSLAKIKITKPIYLVCGGKTRQLSVFNALNYINNCLHSEYVLIHDAARPGLSQKIIDENIEALKTFDATTTILKIHDSIAGFNDLEKFNYLDRNKTFLIQTPQCFKFEIIFNQHIKAYNNNKFDYSDDIQIFNDYPNVKFIEGNVFNLKITTLNDLELLKYYLVNKDSYEFWY